MQEPESATPVPREQELDVNQALAVMRKQLETAQVPPNKWPKWMNNPVIGVWERVDNASRQKQLRKKIPASNKPPKAVFKPR